MLFLRMKARLALSLNRGAETLEDWSHRNAKKTTPDELIVGAIIQSFATNFEDWTISGETTLRDEWFEYYNRRPDRSVLVNEKKALSIQLDWQKRDGARKRNGTPYYFYYIDSARLNDKYELPNYLMRRIVSSYRAMAEKHAALKRTQRQAELEMQANEEKWDLAEKLLGMTRTQLGALVPATQGVERDR